MLCLRGLLLLAALLVSAKGARGGSSSHEPRQRGSREIRRPGTDRSSRFLRYRDPEKLPLLFPQDGRHAKRLSYLHVPDFPRKAVQEEPEEDLRSRTPRGNQTIEDIISGIIHLLGGDVHVTRPEGGGSVRFPTSARPTRINDRGPAHFDADKHKPTPPTGEEGDGSSTHKVLFPGDVSEILGLVNATAPTVSSSDDSASHRSSETVGESSPPSDAASVVTVYETTTRPYTNYTDLPILQSSRSSSATFPTTTTDLLPSRTTADLRPSEGGHRSSTDWLPAGRPPERSGPMVVTGPRSDEPAIITHQPDHFEVTVTRQMYTNASDIGHTRTVTAVPDDVVSSTDISVSIVSTQVDIIYGRPSSTRIAPPLPGDASGNNNNLPPPHATGRPHVFPVDIERVRPKARPPRPPVRPPPPPVFSNNKNGLRPLPNNSPRPPLVRQPPFIRQKPPLTVPEIRIDTCVLGDDSSCDAQLKEQCRTEQGVSACICRLGYARTREREPCRPVVSMILTLKVAKLQDKSIDPSHFVPGTPEFQRLLYEANQALGSLFTLSPLSEAVLGAQVNRVHFVAHRMVINGTVHLDEGGVRGSLQDQIERAVTVAIDRADSRLGTSQLYVTGPLSALVEVEDLNECGDSNLNDCSEFAVCDNLFGTFQCQCKPGYTDKFEGDPRNAGRICSACSPDYCNGKGQCVVVHGRQECRCRGNYGGARCQVDNEVIGVSVGVSVIAVIVIAVTAACLYLWNRRWKHSHQKAQAAAKGAGYRLQTMADHVRWGPGTPFGSTYGMMNGMMADATLQLPAPSPYAIPHALSLPEDGEANPYGRIIRTLQKHNSLNHLPYDVLQSECASMEDLGFPSVPSNSFVFHGSFPKNGTAYR